MKTSRDPRHLGRRFALQVLFAADVKNRTSQSLPERKFPPYKQLIEEVYEEWKEDGPDRHELAEVSYQLASRIIAQVKKNLSEYDKLIGKAAPEWPLDQIPIVDLTILRMALAELTHESPPPHKVIIDEAVELAKEFGGENSSKFINGVLGTVVSTLGIEEADGPSKKDPGDLPSSQDEQ